MRGRFGFGGAASGMFCPWGCTPLRARRRATRVGGVKAQKMIKAALLVVLAATAGTGRGAPAATPGKFFTPLFAEDSMRLEGVLASQDFVIRLPEHVRYLPGSRFNLVFRASPLLLPDVSTMTVSLNGRQLTSLRPVTKQEVQPQKQTVSLALEPDDLHPGWNRVQIRCLLVTTATPCRDVDNPASWVEVDKRTGVEVAYADQALFPELQRFPDTLAEPQLMRMAEEKADPSVSLLLPDNAGDGELRGAFVAAARLGQTIYLPEEAVEIGRLDHFAKQSGERNGVLIAKRDALAKTDLPAEFGLPLRGLQDGEGFVGEFITGEPASGQNRWIVVSGADDEGLQKAVLALGSAPALRDATGNPWVVKQTPVISPVTEKLAAPAKGPVNLDSLPGGGIALRGLFRNATSRAWPLPPGWQTAKGGKLTLEFSHAENLDKTSAFEVAVNDAAIGSIALNEANAQRTRRVMPIPAGLPGRDPSSLTVASYMDIGTVDCAHRNEERAWLDIAGSSTIDAPAEPLVIGDLGRLGFVAVRDAFLRRAAVVVPAEQGKERDAMLVAYAMYLGRELSSMPVLWPQVATYAADHPARADLVSGRSGVVLGSARQWAQAFPKTTPLAAEASPESGDFISLRGQTVPMGDFDRGLVMAQLIDSPWQNGELFAVVGGLGGYGGSGTLAMLTDPELTSLLAGNFAALDPDGRVVNYDTRLAGSDSLADALREGLDTSLTAGEIRARQEARLASREEAAGFNRVMLAGFGGVLGLVFLAERLLSWRRRVNRENNHK